MLYLITMLSLVREVAAADACAAPPRRHTPERYEDFYRIRRHEEERERAREQGREQIAGREVAHQIKMEEARQLYIRTRRAKPDDAAGDAAYKQALLDRAGKIEEARRCYVSQRDRAEARDARGRVVPGDVEYGLDQ